MAKQTIFIGNWSKGINYSKNLLLNPEGYLKECSNFRIKPDGSLYSRGGQIRGNTTTFGANAITGLTAFYMSTGTSYLVGSSGTQLFSWDLSSAIPTEIGNSFVASDWEFVSLTSIDTVYCAGGVSNSVQKWTGTGNVSAVTTIPKCTDLVEHRGRLWAGGSVVSDSGTYTNRIYFSNEFMTTTTAAAYETFDISSDSILFIAIPSQAGKVIRIVSGFDTLIVFCEKDIVCITGTSADLTDWVVRPLDLGHGLLAKRSVAKVDGGFIYLGSDHEVKYLRNEQVEQGVPLVKPTILGYITNLKDYIKNNSSVASLHKICGVCYDGSYFLCYQSLTGTGNNNYIEIKWSPGDEIHGWVTGTTMTANCFVNYKSSSGDKLYYGSSASDGFINQFNVGYNDFDAAITKYALTFANSFNYPQGKKKIKKAKVLLTKDGNWTIRMGLKDAETTLDPDYQSVSLNPGGTQWDEGVWDVDTWGVGLDSALTYFYKGLKCTFVQFAFYHKAIDEYITGIHGIMVYYTQKSPK